MRFTAFMLIMLLMKTLAATEEEPREPAADSLSAVTETPALHGTKTLSESKQAPKNLYPETVRLARNDMSSGESPATKRDEEIIPARETITKNTTDQQPIKYLGGLPREYKLHPAFPDPKTSAIPLRFDLPNSGGQEIPVELSIYSPLGEKINVLLEEELGAGRYEVQWRTDTEVSDPVRPGVYYVLFKTEFFQQVIKVTLSE